MTQAFANLKQADSEFDFKFAFYVGDMCGGVSSIPDTIISV